MAAIAAQNAKAASSLRRVFVVGVGMTKFEKPGRRENFDYPDMAKEAVTKALADCRLPYSAVEQAAVGYVYGDSTCGQRALYQMGLSGVPVYNVNNNCATGSTALFLAKNLVQGGLANCVLALGFEKMQRGSLSSVFEDRTNPMDRHVMRMADSCGIVGSPMAAQLFGNAAKDHMKRYGTTPRHLAKIAFKNHKHSVNNPYSQFQTEYSLEDIEKSAPVFEPLSKLQCCPTSDGGAAAVLASEDFVRQHNLQEQAVEIVGMEMSTDTPSTFEGDMMRLVGYDMTKTASQRLYEKSGLGPEDVQVVELHDCFSANELITYEALGLCKEGEAGRFIDAGDNTYGGRVVVNPSGGLISKGHPLGATGLAQCCELCWQLRGEAGKRQVQNVKVALQHNLGLGGAVVVALYKMPVLSGGKGKDGADFKSVEEVFDVIEAALQRDGKNLVKKARGIFNFVVTKSGGQQVSWIVDAKNGSGSVTKDGKGPSDVTVTMADSDFIKLVQGQLNAQKAFFQGLLKIKGNMGLAMKLPDFLKDAQTIKSKL